MDSIGFKASLFQVTSYSVKNPQKCQLQRTYLPVSAFRCVRGESKIQQRSGQALTLKGCRA